MDVQLTSEQKELLGQVVSDFLVKNTRKQKQNKIAVKNNDIFSEYQWLYVETARYAKDNRIQIICKSAKSTKPIFKTWDPKTFRYITDDLNLKMFAKKYTHVSKATNEFLKGIQDKWIYALVTLTDNENYPYKITDIRYVDTVEKFDVKSISELKNL